MYPGSKCIVYHRLYTVAYNDMMLHVSGAPRPDHDMVASGDIAFHAFT